MKKKTRRIRWPVFFIVQNIIFKPLHNKMKLWRIEELISVSK